VLYSPHFRSAHSKDPVSLCRTSLVKKTILVASVLNCESSAEGERHAQAGSTSYEKLARLSWRARDYVTIKVTPDYLENSLETCKWVQLSGAQIKYVYLQRRT